MDENETSAEEALTEQFTNFAFGPEQTEEPEERVVEPVVEGDEADPEEVEPDESDEPEVKAEEPEYVEIELDGDVLEVPAKYKDHFLRQDDYTQKTQALASERKEVEFIQQQMEATKKQYEFAQSIQTELVKIAQYDEVLAQAETLDWQNMSTDDMIRAKHTLDGYEKEKQKLVDSLSGKQTEFQQAQEQSAKELLKQGTEVLSRSIPGWNEGKQEEMRDYALSDGYTAAEVASVTDPRFVRTLWKAAQYEKALKGAQPAKAKVKEAPTIRAKSRNPMPDDVKHKLNLRKQLKSTKLSDSDKARLVGDDIAKRFGMG